MKIIPKMMEQNITIVPQNKDKKNRSIDQQIDDAKRNYDPNTDDVTVDMDESKSIITENDGTNEWLQVFDNIVKYSGVRQIKIIPYTLSQNGVPITPKVIEALEKRFINDPDYQTYSWLERSHKVLKNGGFGKHITDDKGKTVSFRTGGIDINEQNILALKKFVNTIIQNKDKLVGDPKKFDGIIRSYYNLMNTKGNREQQLKGVGATTNYTGVTDISTQKDVKSKEINSLLQRENDRLMDINQQENPSVTNRITELITSYRITPQSIKRNSSKSESDLIKLKQRFETETNPIKKADLKQQIDILKAQGVDTPENYKGDDLVNANLLLTYAVLINNESLAVSAFELNNQNVDLNQQGRRKGKFIPKLINHLKQIAKERNYENMFNLLNNVNESVMVKKIIMTERQAKLISLLKESLNGKDFENIDEFDLWVENNGIQDGIFKISDILFQIKITGVVLIKCINSNKKITMVPEEEYIVDWIVYQIDKINGINENVATDATKRLGYVTPAKHRKIKNLDKTDFSKKLKDKREENPNIAQNITKDKQTFGYKTPTNRAKTFSIGKDVDEKEKLNNFFAKENKIITKKELIDSFFNK